MADGYVADIGASRLYILGHPKAAREYAPVAVPGMGRVERRTGRREWALKGRIFNLDTVRSLVRIDGTMNKCYRG